MGNTLNDFDLSMQIYQIVTIATMILIFFIAAVTIKKVWRFLDKGAEYFENKKESYYND